MLLYLFTQTSDRKTDNAVWSATPVLVDLHLKINHCHRLQSFLWKKRRFFVSVPQLLGRHCSFRVLREIFCARSHRVRSSLGYCASIVSRMLFTTRYPRSSLGGCVPDVTDARICGAILGHSLREPKSLTMGRSSTGFCVSAPLRGVKIDSISEDWWFKSEDDPHLRFSNCHFRRFEHVL